MSENLRVEKSGRFIFSKDFDVNVIQSRVQHLINLQVNNQEEFLKFSLIDQEILKWLNNAISVVKHSESDYVNFFDENRFFLSRQEIDWLIKSADSDVVDYLIYRYK